jgi:hypothetical protein
MDQIKEEPVIHKAAVSPPEIQKLGKIGPSKYHLQFGLSQFLLINLI